MSLTKLNGLQELSVVTFVLSFPASAPGLWPPWCWCSGTGLHHELLFKEGVMVSKKDVHLPKHLEPADKNAPNLHAMKAMQSLQSQSHMKEQFAWKHFYWCLTKEGIQYLHDDLHLPPEIGSAPCMQPGSEVSELKDSQVRRRTETLTEEHRSCWDWGCNNQIWLHRQLWSRCGQPPQWSGGDCFVLNKLKSWKHIQLGTARITIYNGKYQSPHTNTNSLSITVILNNWYLVNST